MNHDAITRAQQIKRKHRVKSKLQKIAVVLACVVVFCTTYAMILPNMTTKVETYCHLQEHIHVRECYRRVSSLVMTLDCQEYLHIPHAHSKECEDEEGNLVCGQAEFYAHSHGDTCYDAEGLLVCKMPERSSHVHRADCYAPIAPTQGHSHTESCYSSVRGEFICTREEVMPHHHGEECYTRTEKLICGSDEEGHSHGEGCYEKVLSCTVEETDGHSHGDNCYRSEQQLTCGQEETAPSQDSTGGNQAYRVICGQFEAETHVHGENCFRSTEQVLTCGLVEDLNHSHTELCYGNWELSCALPEHTHSIACYSDSFADLETAQQWEGSFTTVDLVGVWPRDVVSIAISQLGYTESAKNYQVMEDGSLKGYSRYGQWYGEPYGDWNAMFAAFCLHYGGMKGMPVAADSAEWIKLLSSESVNLYDEAPYHTPMVGDLVFLDPNEDGIGDNVGIVSEVQYDRDSNRPTEITAIEGNSSNRVQYVSYDMADPRIMGYGDVNRAYKEYNLSHTIDRLYSEDGVNVKVSLLAANGIGDDADLVVERITAEEQPELYEAACLRSQVALQEQISEELPPVIMDHQLFDISFRVNGRKVSPVGEFKVELSYPTEAEVYETYPVYVISHGEEGQSFPTVRSTTVKDGVVTTVFHTDRLDLYAVVAADVRSRSYMSRTAVTEDNLGQLNGTYALISQGYALVTEGLEPKAVELNGVTIEENVYYPSDSSLELWLFDGDREKGYYISTEIDRRPYYLSVEQSEEEGSRLHLTEDESLRTRWLAQSVSPELTLKGGDLYLQFAPNRMRSLNPEPTVGLYVAREYQALFDGQLGAHRYYSGGATKYDGADRIVLSCDAQNQVTVPTGLSSTGAYPYQVVGWYDIVNKQYYGEEYLGKKITLTGDTIFYPDYMAVNYDIGKNVNVVQGQLKLPFVKTHLFDYNELFNLQSVQYKGQIPNITDRENTWDFNTWTVDSQGQGFVLTDWIHSPGENTDGNIGRPLSLGAVNSLNSKDRSYNSSNIPNFTGTVTSGLFGDALREALFAHSDSHYGRHYLGEADMLYRYDEDSGFYYYNSALNAASYNQSERRFYVYDYPVTVKGSSSTGSFLPLNYSTAEQKLNAAGSEVNFWFGMSSEISFYLPHEVGSEKNVAANGEALQFRFSGNDDVWVFVDDQLILDMGGIHDSVYGEINFASGEAKIGSNGARNTASPGNGYMPGLSGNADVITTKLPRLESGRMHRLKIYYLERSSSDSNCAIYFNLAPMYELELVKEDRQNGKPLKGGVFEIFEDPQCTVHADLTVTDHRGESSRSTAFTTNEDGRILCAGLQANKTYYIKETQPPKAPKGHPGYPDMSKYVIKLNLSSAGEPTVILLNSDNEQWVYADAHSFSETGNRVSLTVYGEADIGGNGEVYTEMVWRDDQPTDHEPVRIRLYANGQRTERTLLIGPDNDWKGFFLELPERDAEGKPLAYTVKEDTASAGYRISYEEIRSGGTVTTEKYAWKHISKLVDGGKYILLTDGKALASGGGDSLTMSVSQEEALDCIPDSQSYLWTASASSKGFLLQNGTGGYLSLSDSQSPYFYVSDKATALSEIGLQTDGKLYGTRNNAKRYFRFTDGGYGQSGRQAAGGAYFEVYRWKAEESSATIQAEGWRITASNLQEGESVSVPVRMVWHDNVPEEKIVPVEVELYLVPEAGGKASLTDRLILSNSNGWLGIFEGLPKPEEGYHYYVAEKGGGFIVTYNGTVSMIQIGDSPAQMIPAVKTEPMPDTALQTPGRPNMTEPTVIATDSLYFDFDTNQIPAIGWEQTLKSEFTETDSKSPEPYIAGGNLVLSRVYNSTTVLEYKVDTGYMVKPEDYFEILLTPEGNLQDPALLCLRITVDGILHQVDLGKVQPNNGLTQRFTTEELGLSGRVSGIGFFINGFDLYGDLLKVDYMYLGTHREDGAPETAEETQSTEAPTQDKPVPMSYGEVVISNRCAVTEIPVQKLWEGVEEDTMNPVYLRLYLVKEAVQENGAVKTEVSFQQEIALSKDNKWKNVFPNVVLPDEEAYYVVVETPVAGYQSFFAGDTVEITIDDGSPVTGVKVQLQDGQALPVRVTNAPATELPITGGQGLLLFTMGGTLLVSIAAVFLMYNRKGLRKELNTRPF